MKVCVLATEDSWHLQDLRRAARAHEQIDRLGFEQLADHLPGPHPLEVYDAVLTRAMPAGSLQQVVFRMDVLLKLERLGVPIINPPRAIEMAVDKYLSLSCLQANSIPIPPTAVSQSAAQAMVDYERLGGDVVIKPLFGSMGRGLVRIESAHTARERFQKLEGLGEVIYQQAFIPHRDFDLRLLVIGEKVLGMKRINPHHWISNLAQGARGVPYEPTERERSLALRSSEAVMTRIAGVDLVIDERTQQPMVVEVNSAPSWQGISEVLQLDLARTVLDYLAQQIKSSTGLR